MKQHLFGPSRQAARVSARLSGPRSTNHSDTQSCWKERGTMAHWQKIPGGLTAISAGSRTNVWGVNANANIYRYTGDDANPWVQI
ncbi:tectonin domain-containing protein, partial [Streptomyces sp. NPDC098090]